jgi:hypothetical protein
MLADKILAFFKSLDIPVQLPAGVSILNPYHDAYTFQLCTAFYKTYYADNNTRKLILGINPGRFGAGLTGIPFTDPVKLEEKCGIPNTLNKKPELSADFIYQVIDAYGGPERFYSEFYITSISPLGFVKDGKNLNYYDQKDLESALHDFIIQCLTSQLKFGIDTQTCYCLGEGKNYEFLMKLNNQYRFFESILPLAHPRFIMQYKRKKINTYINDYLVKLSSKLNAV